jgi:formylglycine-generating enzyme required for sulfatase activity
MKTAKPCPAVAIVTRFYPSRIPRMNFQIHHDKWYPGNDQVRVETLICELCKIVDYARPNKRWIARTERLPGLSSTTVIKCEFSTSGMNQAPSTFVIRLHALSEDAITNNAAKEEIDLYNRIVQNHSDYINFFGEVVHGLDFRHNATIYRYITSAATFDKHVIDTFGDVVEAYQSKIISDFARVITSTFDSATDIVVSSLASCPEITQYFCPLVVCDLAEISVEPLVEDDVRPLSERLTCHPLPEHATVQLNLQFLYPIPNTQFAIVGFDSEQGQLWGIQSNDFIEKFGIAKWKVNTTVWTTLDLSNVDFHTSKILSSKLRYSSKAILYPHEMNRLLKDPFTDNYRSWNIALRHSDLHCRNIVASGSNMRVIDIGDAHKNLLWADAARLELDLWSRMSDIFEINAKEVPSAIAMLGSNRESDLSEDELNNSRISRPVQKLVQLSQAIRKGTQSALLCSVVPKEIEKSLAYALAVIAQQKYDLLNYIVKQVQLYHHNYIDQFEPVDQPNQVKNALYEHYLSIAQRSLVYVSPVQPCTATGGTLSQVNTHVSFAAFNEATVDSFQQYTSEIKGYHSLDGLPQSLHELRQSLTGRKLSHTTPKVAVVHGSSGSGKSSLVSSILISKLRKEDRILPIYVEAATEHAVTLANLKSAIAKSIDSAFLDSNLELLTENSSLSDLVSQANRIQRESCETPNNANTNGTAGVTSRKVVVFVDQFEQWLDAKDAMLPDDPLLQAIHASDCDVMQWVFIVREEYMQKCYSFLKHFHVDRIENLTTFYVSALNLVNAMSVLKVLAKNVAMFPDEMESDVQDRHLEGVCIALSEQGFVRPVHLVAFALTYLGAGRHSWDNTPEEFTQNGLYSRLVSNMGQNLIEQLLLNGNPHISRLGLRRVLELLRGYGNRNHRSSMQIKGKRQTVEQLFEAFKNVMDDLCPQDSFEKLMKLLDEKFLVRQVRGVSETYELMHDYLIEAITAWSRKEKEKDPNGKKELLLERSVEIFESTRLPDPVLPSESEWRTLKEYLSSTDGRIAPAGELRAASAELIYACDKHYLPRVRESIAECDPAKLAETLKQSRPFWRQIADSKVSTPLNATPSVGELTISFWCQPKEESNGRELVGKLLQAHPLEIVASLNSIHESSLLKQIPVSDTDPQELNDSQLLRWHFISGFISNSTDVGNLVRLLLKNDEGILADWIVALKKSNDLSGSNDSRADFQKQILSSAIEQLDDRSNDGVVRVYAAQLIADYAGRSVGDIILAILASDAAQYRLLYSELAKENRFSPQELTYAKEELKKAIDNIPNPLVDEWPIDRTAPQPEENSEYVALKEAQYKKLRDIDKSLRRAATAIVTLCKLLASETKDETERNLCIEKVINDAISHRHPELRSYVIDRLSILEFDANILLRLLTKHLKDENSRQGKADLLRTLLLSLGRYEDARSQVAIRACLKSIRNLCGGITDSGVHSALEWIYERYKLRCDPSQQNITDANWHRMTGVDEYSLKMIKVPKNNNFTRGTPWFEDFWSDSHRVANISVPSFWISAHHIPWSLWNSVRPFAIDANCQINFDYYRNFEVGWDDPCPATWFNWDEAARFCNKLSKAHGLSDNQLVFSIDSQGKAKVVEDYQNREGYRPPTELEIEFATRAGAYTAYHYGDSVELLRNYACYQVNSGNRTAKVGSYMPNDWGLFDTIGNCYTWCLDYSTPYGDPNLYLNDKPENVTERAVRGGSYFDPPTDMRSGYRYRQIERKHFIGLRVVRSSITKH